jgi:S1-C subfamily serine protease
MFNPSIPTPLSAFSAAVADLVRAAAPGVVSVKSQHAQSSGFVWRPGLVVAAENALADDGAIDIVAHDGASARAELVGRDPSSDVALLRVQRADLPQVPPSGGGPTAGALALVVAARDGAPAASLGIVSYAGPQWRSMRGGVIDARIELSAGLRRSSEGGLALDAEGRAFGMAVFGPRRRTLVIPTATIDRVAATLVAKGRVARGYLGLGLQPVKLDGGGLGLMAISVDARGPGAAAGVKQGDVIVAWNGEPLRGVHHLMRLMGPDSVGSTVKLSLRRAGEPLELEVTIGERPQAP